MRTAVSRAPRRAVAAYDSYGKAQRAVDRLSDRGSPVDSVAIIGHGLRYVEHVTGRLTIGRAAVLGALYSALLVLIFTYDSAPAVPFADPLRHRGRRPARRAGACGDGR